MDSYEKENTYSSNQQTTQLQNEKLDPQNSFFNILVCGAAGIGKTSFIDLFIGQFNKEEYIETFRGKKEIILPKTDGFPVKEKKIKHFNL